MKASFRDHLKSRNKAKKSKFSVKSRRTDGLCLDEVLMCTAVFETEIGAKKTKKYSFDVQVCLKNYLSGQRKLCEGVEVVEENGEKKLKILASNRNEEEKKPTYLTEGSTIRVGTFNQPEGDCRVGDVLALYGVEVSWFHSTKTDKTYFSYQCHSTKIRQMSRKELTRLWSSLNSKSYLIKNPQLDDWKQQQVVMRIGWASEEETNAEKGCFTQPPEITEERVTFSYDKQDGEGKKAMFSAGYTTWDWDCEGGKEDIRVIYTEATLFSNHIAKNFGITKVEDWLAFGPKLMKDFKGVFLGYPNKDKTRNMELNDGTYQRDIQKTYEREKEEAAQKGETLPAPPPHYGIKMNVQRFLSNPIENIQNAAFEVPMEFVRDTVYKKEDGTPELQATSVYAQGNPWNNDYSVGLVNMNELYGDRSVYYKNGSNRYWFVCNADIEEEEIEEIKQMSLEQRKVAFGGGKKKAQFKWKKGIVYVEKVYKRAEAANGTDTKRKREPEKATKSKKKK